MQVLSLGTCAGSLLVPVGVVAQIAGSEERISQAHELPFIRNQIQWREYSMPLVYSSEMLGAGVGSDDACKRSVIFWPMKGCGHTELFALTSLDSPKVLNLDEDVAAVRVDTGEGAYSLYNSRYVLGLVRLEDKPGIIPNLKYLAETIFLK